MGSTLAHAATQAELQCSTHMQVVQDTALAKPHPHSKVERTVPPGPVRQGSAPSSTSTVLSCRQKGSTPAALCSDSTRLRVK